MYAIYDEIQQNRIEYSVNSILYSKVTGAVTEVAEDYTDFIDVKQIFRPIRLPSHITPLNLALLGQISQLSIWGVVPSRYLKKITLQQKLWGLERYDKSQKQV